MTLDRFTYVTKFVRPLRFVQTSQPGLGQPIISARSQLVDDLPDLL